MGWRIQGETRSDEFWLTIKVSPAHNYNLEFVSLRTLLLWLYFLAKVFNILARVFSKVTERDKVF